MLMLLFYIGDDRYALDSKRVVEVVPRVTLKKLHRAPEHVPGLFNYRGCLVPVIDLCHLIQGVPCRVHLSTRIILVNCQNTDSSPTASQAEKRQVLGLMAERVTDTVNRPETDFMAPGIQMETAPYLGQTIADDRGMIQFVRVEYLLPESQQAYLLPHPEESSSY